MPPDPNLLFLQRRFLACLQEPIFGESRARSALPPREGTVSRGFVQAAEALIAPSKTLRPVERLELYHRQYWYRLLDSIAEDFPVLRALLGRDTFWGLLEAYLEASPPTSFTLRHLGAGLADFIAAGSHPLPHPVHAEEIARLEYALCAAFEAGKSPPIRPEDLGTAAIALQPHLHLLAFRTNADTLWRRAARGRRIGNPLGPNEVPRRFVAVFRHDLGLYVERLPRAAHAILAAIDAAGSLESAMERVASRPGRVRGRDLAQVSEWFRTWIQRGWIRRGEEVPSPVETQRPRARSTTEQTTGSTP